MSAQNSLGKEQETFPQYVNHLSIFPCVSETEQEHGNFSEMAALSSGFLNALPRLSLLQVQVPQVPGTGFPNAVSSAGPAAQEGHAG